MTSRKEGIYIRSIMNKRRSKGLMYTILPRSVVEYMHAYMPAVCKKVIIPVLHTPRFALSKRLWTERKKERKAVADRGKWARLVSISSRNIGPGPFLDDGCVFIA